MNINMDWICVQLSEAVEYKQLFGWVCMLQNQT